MKNKVKKYTEWFSSVFLLTKVLKRLLKDTLPGNGVLVGSVVVIAIFMALMPIGSSYTYSKVLGSISSKEALNTVMFWLVVSIVFSSSVVLMGGYAIIFRAQIFHPDHEETDNLICRQEI